MRKVTATIVEMTTDQYFEIVAKRKTKARYAAFERGVQKALRKFARSMDETKAIRNEIEARRRERTRLHIAIRDCTANK